MIDETDVPRVVPAATLTSLATRLTAIGNSVVTSTTSAKTEWGGLDRGFQVSGAEGAYRMMDRPATDAAAFASAISSGSIALSGEVWSFQQNETSRTELISRVRAVNARYADAARTQSNAQLEWNQTRRFDPDAAADRQHPDLAALRRANTALEDASEEIRQLRRDIDAFASDVEQSERRVAQALQGVWGGDVVRGRGGTQVTASSQSWSAPGRYRDAPQESFADRFRNDVSAGAAQRIRELSGQDADSVRTWIAAHPDFASTVPLLSPEQGAALWGQLDAQANGGAALAVLFAAAPMLVGNLNGAPATKRNEFNQEYLRQLLGDTSITGDARDQLLLVQQELRTNPSPTSLLNLFIDTNGEPRAAVAYGDVERAAQILTVTHGIRTDLGDGANWFGTASNTYQDTIDELVRRGVSPADAKNAIATVAYFGWESGGTTTVQHTYLAEAGAAQYTQFVEGLRHNNPSATVSGWFHSYGTTMAAEAQAARPGLLDHMTFFGSAGIDENARDAIAGQIEDGTLSLDATHASRDWTAPLGRQPGLSQHDVNVLDEDRGVPGVREFSSEGGSVDFGPGGTRILGVDADRVEQGRQVEGHGAHHHSPWYEGWRGQTGYFDNDSQAYLEALRRLAGNFGV